MLHLSPAAGRMKPDIQQFRANWFDSSRQRALANWVKLLVASGTFQSQRFLQQRIATSRIGLGWNCGSEFFHEDLEQIWPPVELFSHSSSIFQQFNQLNATSFQYSKWPISRERPTRQIISRGEKIILQTSFWTIKNTSVLGKDYSLWIIPSLLQLL